MGALALLIALSALSNLAPFFLHRARIALHIGGLVRAGDVNAGTREDICAVLTAIFLLIVPPIIDCDSDKMSRRPGGSLPPRSNQFPGIVRVFLQCLLHRLVRRGKERAEF